MFQAYKHYADFQGRAGRSEYWLFALFVLLVVFGFVIVTAAVAAATGSAEPNILVMLLYGVFLLGSFIPSLAVGFRRLHDTNRSAWWLLISLIPLVGSIALLVFYCLPGTPGPNRFGPPPGAPREDLQATFA
jgi:uncharacterized membrane protein YhaH (DUF805 family)